MCNFNNFKVTCSIQLLDKQPLLCNHMPMSYSNTIAQLFNILPSHRQCDCLCHHCACLCHQRKGTTESYIAKKDHPGGHDCSPPRRRSCSKRLQESLTEKKTQERTWQCKTTGPRAVDSECNGRTSDESDKPRGRGESKSKEEDSKKEESNDPSGDSKPSEHARLNEVKEEGVASGIWQLTLQDRILVNTTPPEQQTEPMASNLAGPSGWAGTRTDSITLKAAHPDPFYGGNLKAKIFLQQVDNKIADAAGASEGQRIRYMISLLRKSAAEWAAMYMDNKRYTTFTKNGDLRRKFLERFTDSNPSGTALARLLQLKQGCTRIQDYATKALTLAHQSQIGN